MAGNVEMSDPTPKNTSGNLSYSDQAINNSNGQHECPDETLIFQCAKCRSVFGDTTTWACADDILRTISLKRVSDDVQITDELDTSKTGTDVGSTYNVLKCEACKEKVGKMYRTTPSHLDKLRGLFTLYVDKLSSYQIGSTSQSNNQTTLETFLSYTDCKAMSTEISKIKQVLLSLDSRIKNIETFLCEEYDDQSESTVTDNVMTTPIRDEEQPLPAGFQMRDQFRRSELGLYDNGFEGKKSSIQETSTKSTTPQFYHRKEDEKADDRLQGRGEGRSSSSRSYIDNLKRKMASNSRSDGSVQISKRSKY